MIDLAVTGDTAGCRSCARDLDTLAARLDDVRKLIKDGSRDSEAEWEGLAAEAFRQAAEPLAGEATDIGQHVSSVSAALVSFAAEIDTVRADMRQVRMSAQAAGLDTSSDLVHSPSAGASPALVLAYRQAERDAAGVRRCETTAHTRLDAALAAADGSGWLVDALRQTGALPPDHADGGELIDWVGDKIVDGLEKGLPWAGILTTSRFAPRVNGRFVPVSGQSLLSRLDPKNWTAKPFQAKNLAGWRTAGRWVGKAGGGIVTGAVAAWGQWQHDAQDPSLTDEERGERAAARGSISAAGAIGGAAGGAAVGAAVGSVVPVLGTAAGGVVGGVVGGVIGSGVADWAGDRIVNHFDETVDFVAFWD